MPVWDYLFNDFEQEKRRREAEENGQSIDWSKQRSMVPSPAPDLFQYGMSMAPDMSMKGEEEEKRPNPLEPTAPVEQRAQAFEKERKGQLSAPPDENFSAGEQSQPSPSSVTARLQKALAQLDEGQRDRVLQAFGNSGPGLGGLFSGIGAAIAGRDPSGPMGEIASQRRQSLQDVLENIDANQKDALKGVELQSTLDEETRLGSAVKPDSILGRLYLRATGQKTLPPGLTERQARQSLPDYLKLRDIEADEARKKEAGAMSLYQAERVRLAQEAADRAAEEQARKEADATAARSTPLGEARDADSAKKLREIDNAARDIQQGLVVMRSIRDQAGLGGFEVLDRGLVNRGLQAARAAQLAAKELFNLGVLNGPDLALMEQIIPTDPTGLGFVSAKIDEAEAIMNRRLEAAKRGYLKDPGSSASTSSPTPPGRTPEQVREEMRAGKITRDQARKELESMNYGR